MTKFKFPVILDQNIFINNFTNTRKEKGNNYDHFEDTPSNFFFFFSGGSDIPEYHQNNFGAAFSATINKFVYVIIHENWNQKIVTKFDTVEESDDINAVRHSITQNSLKFRDIDQKFIITSIADIPSGGSGLGSSSSFTVGLNNALRCFQNPTYYSWDDYKKQKELAEEACQVEINMCGFPIGKQDQYAAAYGGFNLFSFFKNNVNAASVNFNENILNQKLLLYYTGVSRNANEILLKQSAAMMHDDKIKRITYKNVERALMGAMFLRDENFDDFGSLLHDAWMDKRQVVEGITNSYLDSIYETAMKHGALGGKVLGAGGGGFILFYVPSEESRHNVQEMLRQYPKLIHFPFQFYNRGSEIVSQRY